MNVDRARIQRMVPQAGAMCLLDAVTQWDSREITCTAAGPNARHPLARESHVPSVIACEYGAQAAAVHGALVDGTRSPRPGMLASLIGVNLHRASFPPETSSLVVRARMSSRTDSACLYAFEVHADGVALADGQIMVALSAPERA